MGRTQADVVFNVVQSLRRVTCLRGESLPLLPQIITSLGGVLEYSRELKGSGDHSPGYEVEVSPSEETFTIRLEDGLPPELERFMLAVALGELFIMYPNKEGRWKRCNRSKPTQLQLGYFARCLLVPASQLRLVVDRFKDESGTDIAKLSEYFGVSSAIIFARISELYGNGGCSHGTFY